MRPSPHRPARRGSRSSRHRKRRPHRRAPAARMRRSCRASPRCFPRTARGRYPDRQSATRRVQSRRSDRPDTQPVRSGGQSTRRAQRATRAACSPRALASKSCEGDSASGCRQALGGTQGPQSYGWEGCYPGYSEPFVFSLGEAWLSWSLRNLSAKDFDFA